MKTFRASPAKGRKKPTGSLVLSMPVTRKSGRGDALLEVGHRLGDDDAGTGVVAAVEPELGLGRRPGDERAGGEALQAGRPVDGQEPGLDRGGRDGEAGAAQRRDRRSRR